MFDIDATSNPRKPARKAPEPIPPGCSQCQGRPFVSIERAGEHVSVRCACERGEYFKAKDSERRRA